MRYRCKHENQPRIAETRNAEEVASRNASKESPIAITVIYFLNYI
jgi:hypothetical protein